MSHGLAGHIFETDSLSRMRCPDKAGGCQVHTGIFVPILREGYQSFALCTPTSFSTQLPIFFSKLTLLVFKSSDGRRCFVRLADDRSMRPSAMNIIPFRHRVDRPQSWAAAPNTKEAAPEERVVSRDRQVLLCEGSGGPPSRYGYCGYFCENANVKGTESVGMGPIRAGCGPVLNCPRNIQLDVPMFYVFGFGIQVGGAKVSNCVP